MPYSIIYGTPEIIAERLNGYLRFGTLPKEGLPIGGLTLIFTSPAAATVTFPGALNAMVTPAQVATAITAGVAGATAKMQSAEAGGGLSGVVSLQLLIEAAAGVAITAAGTANTAFRLSTTTATAAVPIAAAKVLGFGPENLTSRFFALIAP
jgi:hypothetical protein